MAGQPARRARPCLGLRRRNPTLSGARAVHAARIPAEPGAASERRAPPLRNDDAPPASPEPVLPGWVRVADVLTLLLGAAALQAAVFGGFQVPGLSVTNPWRPLVMALVVAGLRHHLVRTPPAHARLWEWSRRIWLAEAAPATRQEDWPRADLSFFRIVDFIVLSVVSISFTAISLLVVSRFDARVAVIAGLILAAVVRWFTPARFDAQRASAGRPVGPVLLLVLLAALSFRTEPFPTLDGDRIPDIYASMSAHLQREGTAFVDDRLPEALPDERSREIYRAGGPDDSEPGSPVRPELDLSPARDGDVFRLRPLHPLWMAIFGEVFGDAARFHAPGFFGLLGVLGLSLLAFELTGSRPAAFAAGILVATNPLHVFFSRSPAPEAVALAFSSLGLYYLARAFRGMRHAAPAATTSLVTLAAACVSLVFFVRAAGFPYILAAAPLFGLGVRLKLRTREAWGRRVLGFCAAVAGLYGVSVLYGLTYAAGDAPSVHERTLGSLLGRGWPLVVAGILALAAAGLAEVARNPQRPAVRRLLAATADPRPWIRLASVLVAVALAGSLLQAYLIGFTELYAADPRYQELGVVGSGAYVFLQSGAAGWLLYVTPWLAAVAMLGMHRLPPRWPLALLYGLLGVCMAATLLAGTPVVHRHYDQARLLLGETVPYALIIAVAVTFRAAPGRFRRLGMAALLAAIPLQLFLTAKQMPVREDEQPHHVMSRIAGVVANDVLLFDVEESRAGTRFSTTARLQTPLTHYFGLRIFPFHGANRIGDVVPSFEGAVGGGRLRLLTPAANPHSGLELYETFACESREMGGAATIPSTVDGGPRAADPVPHRRAWNPRRAGL